CTDRVYRIGQKREVTVYLPLAEHPAYGDRSYDLVLDKLLEEKRTISRGVFVSTEIGGAELRRRMDASTNEGGDSFDPTELDRMEPLAFEAWFGRQARKAYLEVQLTPRTGDGGADLIFRHPAWNRSAIVQCKHRADPNAPMDERALDDLDRAVRAYEEPDALRIAATNASRFTQTAIRRAERDGIMLLTRDTLHTGLRNITEMLGRPAH
ncbi:MAG: restriction endonuclease, partial [Alphaproteobacteria bacterium]|nr:restriction endonuclease [Alphaproteobacteria bacterium]